MIRARSVKGTRVAVAALIAVLCAVAALRITVADDVDQVVRGTILNAVRDARLHDGEFGVQDLRLRLAMAPDARAWTITLSGNDDRWVISAASGGQLRTWSSDDDLVEGWLQSVR